MTIVTQPHSYIYQMAAGIAPPLHIQSLEVDVILTMTCQLSKAQASRFEPKSTISTVWLYSAPIQRSATTALTSMHSLHCVDRVDISSIARITAYAQVALRH